MAGRKRNLRRMEMVITLVYVIQKLGQGTFVEITDVLHKIGVSNKDEHFINDCLEALKKRDLVSINKRPDEDGMQVNRYSLKGIQYASMPEAAHIKDLLPKMLEDEGVRKLKNEFDDVELEPDTETSKNGNGKQAKASKAKYTDAHLYTAVYQLEERIYGGRMISPALKALLDNSPFKAKIPRAAVEVEEEQDDGTKKKAKKKIEIGLFFDRAQDGRILIHKGCVKGWFSKSLPRITPHGESVGREHCSFQAVLITPADGVHVVTLPVRPAGFSRGGSPPQTHETLMPGEIIEVRFWAPTRGFMEPVDVEKYCRFLGQHAPQHLSPARGTETGKMQLLAFIDHGHTWDVAMAKTPDQLDAEVATAMKEVSVPKMRRHKISEEAEARA